MDTVKRCVSAPHLAVNLDSKPRTYRRRLSRIYALPRESVRSLKDRRYHADQGFGYIGLFPLPPPRTNWNRNGLAAACRFQQQPRDSPKPGPGQIRDDWVSYCVHVKARLPAFGRYANYFLHLSQIYLVNFFLVKTMKL